MAISYYAEVTRANPASKNAAGEKVRYNIRVFYKNDDVIQQMGGIGLVGNLGNYASVNKYNVANLSYGDIKTTSETGSYGTGAKFYVDVTAATSGVYTPGFTVDIYDPGIIGATRIGTSIAADLTADPTLLPVTFKIPAGQTVKIPTINATKAKVTPDMPYDLIGRNNDFNQTGLDSSVSGFRYYSCNKSWITIWIKTRWVRRSDGVEATTSQTAQLNAGVAGAPKGYGKQYQYRIEQVLHSAYTDHPGKTLEQLRSIAGQTKILDTVGWDWADTGKRYQDPKGTVCYAVTAKADITSRFKKYINSNCEAAPVVDNGNGDTLPPINVDDLIARFNPPPHITTRHFSPIADRDPRFE